MIKLALDDCRRLTGKNLLWDHWGGIMDAFVEGIDKQQVVDIWLKYVQTLLVTVGWGDEKTQYRIFENGVSLAISAPKDALYAALEIIETAWFQTCAECLQQPPPANREAELKQLVSAEANPKLLALIAQADSRKVPWLVDDDEFSLGYGVTVEVWPIDQLPDINQLNWAAYQRVPTVFITGTNGKSTSVRLTSEIIKRTGKACGVTSTDFIRVGDTIIDKGDYSGPGGARMLLRDPRVEVALLEVARGGILRRGLPVNDVDAALITNIARDHLGQYGINTMAGLTATKFVVAKGLAKDGILVLNADDAELVRYAANVDCRKCWFAIDPLNPVLVAHRQANGAVCYVKEGLLIYHDDNGPQALVAVNAVPMTFNGAARHNIENALGVIGLAKSLNIANQAILQGLTEFHSDVSDNPGRGNVFSVKGAAVIMDFAHNEHSMAAIAATTANMPGQRKYLMISSAGDRSDSEIINMTKAALKMKPDEIVIAELYSYLRGRELGEVPSLITQACLESGYPQTVIHYVDSPLPGATWIVSQLTPDDLALMLVLCERDEVVELLTRHG